MRIRRSYKPGIGVVEERVGGEETYPRRRREGVRNRKGDIWFNPETNRIEARGADGEVIGMELPKGN